MDMADPEEWLWVKKYNFPGYNFQFLGCHWTDASLPLLGHKGIVLLGGLSSGSTSKFLVIIDPLDSSTGTFVQKLFRYFNVDALNVVMADMDSLYTVRTHLRMSGNQIRLYGMGKNSGGITKFLEIKHEVGTSIVTTKQVQFKIGPGWGALYVKNTDFMFTDTSLYMAYSGPMRKTAVGAPNLNAIARININSDPLVLDFTVSGLTPASIRAMWDSTAHVYSDYYMYDSLTLGPFAKFNNLLSFISFTADYYYTYQQATVSDDFYLGVECTVDSNLYSSIKFTSQGYFHHRPRALYAHDDRTYYYIFNSRWRETNQVKELVVAKLSGKFTTSSCGSSVPVLDGAATATVFKPPVVNPKSAAIAQNNPGKGSVLISNSVQGFILTGQLYVPETLQYLSQDGHKRGFAIAIKLSEVDNNAVDEGWTAIVVDLLDTWNPVSSILESDQDYANQAQDLNLVDDNLSDWKGYSPQTINACTFSLKLKNPFPSTTTRSYEYNSKIGSVIGDGILIDELVDTTNGCPVTTAQFVLYYDNIPTTLSSTSYSTYDSSTNRINMVGNAITNSQGMIQIQNLYSVVITPLFTITVQNSPCNSAAISMTNMDVFLPVGIKYDIDGIALAFTEEECPPVTYDLIALNILTVGDITNCPPSTAEISQILQYSPANTIAPSQWSPMFTLTQKDLKIEKYHLMDKTFWLYAQIHYNFFNDYVTGVVNTRHSYVYFSDHPCQAKSFTVTATDPIVNEIEIKMTISDFDKVAINIPTGKDLTLKSILQIKSSDEVNCPITAWKINSFSKICDSTFTCSPIQSETLATMSFVSFTKETGEITVKEQLDEMNLYISVKATTFFNFIISTDLWKLKMRFNICFGQDSISIQLDKAKTATLEITVWESDKNTIVALGNVTALSFNPKTDNFFTNTKSSDCPFLKFRMKEILTSSDVVVPEANYKDFISFNNVTAKLDIQDYTKINTTILNGTKIQVGTITESKQSAEGSYLTLLTSEFKCDKDKVAKKETPEEIKVSYQTFVKFTGEMVKPEASAVEAMELDLSTGYFDTGSQKNCSLTEWSLTKVKSKDDTELASTSWAEIFLFDNTTQKLKVKEFGGADLTTLGETKLIFQAKLENEIYSHEYHFVTVIIEETFLIDTEPPKPPFFKSRLAPILITLDFEDTTATFAPVIFEFPELVDPQESEIEPIKITNLADLGFATFAGTKLTIDPSKFKKSEIGSNISVKVLVKNALEVEGEYFLTISVQQVVKAEPILAPVVEPVPEPVVEEPEPEPEPEAVVEEEEKKEVKKEKKVKAVAGLAFVPDWNKFFNKDKPKAREANVFNPEEEEEVVIPPQPAELRVLSLGSKGEFSISFSDAIEFPEALKQKFERDKILIAEKAAAGPDGAANITGATRRLKRGGVVGGDFLDFKIEGATNMKQKPLDDSMFVIEELSDTKISLKINFPDPASISLSDQSVQDRLKIGFSELPIGKNGLPLKTTGLASNADGSLSTDLNIQPMVDENSQSQKALDQASDSVYYSGIGMMLLQFLITLVASTSLSFFWTLINSQINYVYLPLLSVNPPGQVSFYFDILIYVCTFDPIPTDLVYEAIPIWAFDKVNMANERDVFSRIGVEDRNIINVLGSLFLFMTFFIFGQSLFQFLRPLAKYSAKARKYMRRLSVNAAYRTIFIIFFLETYLDLLIGGFINSENIYLLNDSKNWGWTAWMTKSDQFAIILGNIIFVGCLVFPFIVMIILQQKYNQRYNTDFKQDGFNNMYSCLFEGLRTNQPGYTHYYSIYLLRKLIFGMIVYNLHEMHYCSAQVMANMYLSFLFICYLVVFKPFLNQHEQLMQVLNEICFYLVSFMYICFTDINPNAENKLIIGWFIIFLVLANLIWPNGSTMVKGIWPDIKALFVKEPKNRKNWRMEDKRQALVRSYDLKLKEQFKQVKEVDFASAFPSGNQVAPTDLFADLGLNSKDVYQRRADNTLKRHTISDVPKQSDLMDGYMDLHLSQIQEMASYQEESSQSYDGRYSEIHLENDIENFHNFKE